MHDISRVTRSHAQARASYDRLSRWYDFIEGGWENRPRRLGLDLLQVKLGEKVLELASGTGSSLLELSEVTCPVGLDLSSGMLALTRTRLKKVGKQAEVVRGDALTLPFPSGNFDAAFMAFALELMDTPEIPLVLGEIRRVLQPGGRLGVVSSSKLGGLGFMQRIYEWSHTLLPAVVDCRPIFVRRFLEEAGFTMMDYRLLSQTGLGIEVLVGRISGSRPFTLHPEESTSHR